MSFFDKLFGVEQEKVDTSPRNRRGKNHKQHMEEINKSENNSNEFIDSLSKVISEAKKMVSKSPKIDIIQKEAINIVEGFFYSNIITNFKKNLTEDNLKELNITNEDVNKIKKEFSQLFETCENIIEECYNNGKINSQIYQEFKEKLNIISKNSYKLLVELEKHIDIDLCEKIIHNFKKEIKTIGKEFKINTINRDGSVGISIGFNSDGDDEYSDSSEYSREITDFDNFTIEFEEFYEKDIDFTHKNIILEDKNSHFYGEYHQSNDKRYIVTYCDAYGRVDKNNKEKFISGQVYLIEHNKILWKKNIDRPNAAFVTNEGNVIVVDWVSFAGKPCGKIYFFDKKGIKTFENIFNSNIGEQSISKDETEFIVTTCFPENAIYLFDVKNKNLVKKVNNNLPQRPLLRFNFDKIKKYIVENKEFDDIAYEQERLKHEKEAEEEKQRIESLKKKTISELTYDEIVLIGSLYAGDFYDNKGEPDKALLYFHRAIELKSEKPQPYVLKLIGFCYEKIKDYKNAIKYYEESINRYPQYKKSVVVDHIEFCNLKLNKKIDEDWTSFIIKKREKERNHK